MLPKTLAERGQSAKIEIMRSGLPRAADRYTGRRFRGVGEEEPKASDHCPVIVEIQI